MAQLKIVAQVVLEVPDEEAIEFELQETEVLSEARRSLAGLINPIPIRIGLTSSRGDFLTGTLKLVRVDWHGDFVLRALRQVRDGVREAKCLEVLAEEPSAVLDQRRRK